VYPTQTPQQPPPAQQPPPDQQPNDCPDPNGPFTEYRVAAAVAAERSRLYIADAPLVQQRYDKLAGAQTRFADAKTAQRSAFDELRQRIERIAAALDRDLTAGDRQRLKNCWDQLNKETTPPTTRTDCTKIDGMKCDNLPKDAAELHSLSALAGTCVERADQEFDELANLPEALGPLVTDLLTKATKLEQDICATRSDLERSYVEYLGLQQRFAALEQVWITPTAYGCRLKVLFATLLHRHEVTICLKVEVFRQDRLTALEEEARKAKQDNLIDLVLECAQPKSGSGQPGGQPSQQYQSQPPQQQYPSQPAQSTPSGP
jgi:hypothetical protein